MGYRSEVLVCVPETEFFKASDEIKLWLKNCDETFKCDIDETKEIGLVFRWEEVKWYSGYDDVDAIEKWIEDIDLKTKNAGILRIGEDDEDIMMCGSVWKYPTYVVKYAELGEMEPYNVQFPDGKEAI